MSDFKHRKETASSDARQALLVLQQLMKLELSVLQSNQELSHV